MHIIQIHTLQYLVNDEKNTMIVVFFFSVNRERNVQGKVD